MRALRSLVILAAVLLAFPISARAQTPDPLPPPPSDFNPKAKAPPDLPKTLEIPRNMRIDVSVWRKKPIHYPSPPNPNSLDILMDPDLEGAVIERADDDIHATFHWQGDRTSEAFIIRGFGFRKVNFATPNLVVPSMAPMNFWLNRQDLTGGAADEFPGISWYAPSAYAGTASFKGSAVLVFAQNGVPSGAAGYPEANSVCLDPKTLAPLYLDDGVRVFTFTYTPDANVQIDPQGPYLQAIQKHFGHYP